MKRLGIAVALVALAFAPAQTVNADPIGATVGATDFFGAFNTFYITNNAGSSANITSVTINVATGANPGHFDTSGLGSLDFSPLFGSDVTTGLTSPSSVADNATSVTIQFSDFNPGETFAFNLDVDGQNPAGGGILGALARALQDETEMLGSLISVSFGGQNYLPATLNGSLDSTGSLFGIDVVAYTTVTGEIQAIPEPTSLVVFGVASLGAGLYYRRRNRARPA